MPAGPLLLPGSPATRRLMLMVMDGLLLTAGLFINFEIWIRFKHPDAFPPEYAAEMLHVIPPIVLLRLALFYGFGLYRAIARRTGTYELKLIFFADTIVTAVILLFNLATPLVPFLGSYPLDAGGAHILRIPWGIVLNDWMLTLILVSGVRLLRREIEVGLLRVRPGDSKGVLIVGAGDAGEQVARDLIMSTRGAFRPLAYVDPDPAMVGHKIHGLPVEGTLKELPRVIDKHRPDEIVIALQRPTPRVLSEIVEQCRTARVEFKIVPPLTSVMSGRTEVSMLRPVEIEDLLGRETVDLKASAHGDSLSGKRVLVTGAGGSIGQELSLQALEEKPAALILFDHAENNLFEALIELNPLAEEKRVELVSIVGDIGDRGAVESLFERHRPQVVFHTAAHKHVHFMEVQPAEAVKNNVRGTLILAEAAKSAGAERFIFISTDKAVRPTGVMGASKRVAEMIVSAIGEQADGVFVSVRFGNVLGSRGSVLPTFRRQIEQGGPVTVTHPEATRYFMTTAEAVSLVIEAGAQARGGEVYILDMGRPVRIVDLARNLITLSGLEPERDIEIVFTGLRPGEKLTEDLLTQDEGVDATESGKIFIARNEPWAWDDLEPSLNRLIGAAERGDGEAVRSVLAEMIPDSALAESAAGSSPAGQD